MIYFIIKFTTNKIFINKKISLLKYNLYIFIFEKGNKGEKQKFFTYEVFFLMDISSSKI